MSADKSKPYDERVSAGGRCWRGPSAPSHPLGRMIYVGLDLVAVNGRRVEPALINPALRVDPLRGGGAVTASRPSYSGFSPAARAAYQEWLKTGRNDPAAPIGHLLLYFYGLERRAVYDARSEPAARAERPAICAELTRLLGIYGAQQAFASHAKALLDYLAAHDAPPRSYLAEPTPQLGTLTQLERIALSQCARDGAPLPVAWALRWLQADAVWASGGGGAHQTGELAAFVAQQYRRRYGEGLVLAVEEARLELRYHPESPSFHGMQRVMTLDTGLPEVHQEAFHSLAALFLQAARRFGAYGGTVIEQERPGGGWPAVSRRFLGRVRTELRPHAPRLTAVSELEDAFPELLPLTPFAYERLCEALARDGIGMQPDPFFCFRAPGMSVVLFQDDHASAARTASPRYLRAALNLDLAGAVASAGCVITREHVFWMRMELDGEEGLTASEQERLLAHLEWVQLEPPKLATLELALEGLSPPEREHAGDFLVKVIRGDWLCVAATGGVRAALRRALRTLGLNEDELLARHVIKESDLNPGAIPPLPPGLDPHELAAVQAEDALVSALLDSVFSHEIKEPDAPLTAAQLGLGPAASAFLRQLLTRPRWTRAELVARAREYRLPPDGLLGVLNDAVYDRLNIPLFEYEYDSLVLNGEAVARINVSGGPEPT